MANKRTLKKQIRRVCGDLAAETVIAYQTIPAVTSEVAGQIVGNIFEVQCGTLSRISFAFDRSRADFGNDADYRVARSRYNAAAFARLRNDFANDVAKILKELNSAIPDEVREANKKN